MKRTIIFIAVIMLFSMLSYAESIVNLIPENDLWGISQEEFLKLNGNTDFFSCEIGGKEGLMQTEISIDSYPMDAYYVFDADMVTTTGTHYTGLSKVTYILTENDSGETIQSCFDALVNDMEWYVDEPDKKGESVATWLFTDVQIKIGKGTFEKYTGSQAKSVAVVITGADISNPRNTTNPTAKPSPTPTPTPTPSPTPTPTPSPTPEPTKKASMYSKMFIPENMASRYNSIVPIAFELFGINDEDIESFAKVQFSDYSTDESIIYTNTNNTIQFIFHGTDTSSPAEWFEFSVSLDNENILSEFPHFFCLSAVATHSHKSWADMLTSWLQKTLNVSSEKETYHGGLHTPIFDVDYDKKADGHSYLTFHSTEE